MVLQRQIRQQQKDKVKTERETAAAMKLRYPIADALLHLEPVDPELKSWPQPRFGMNLFPEVRSHEHQVHEKVQNMVEHLVLLSCRGGRKFLS